jgi:hypothetical protein
MQPTSLLGSGFIEEESDPMEQASLLQPQGSLTPGIMSMMAPPPPVPVSPGLAGNSGMLSAMQGRADNPYLAQQQKASDSAVDQQQGMMRTAGYLQQQELAAQAQQLRMQEMKARAQRAKAVQQTKERELEVKANTELLKNKNPLAQKIGERGMREYYSRVHGVDIPEGALTWTEHDFKKEDRDHVDGLLKLLPKGSTDFTPIMGGLPQGVPPGYLESRKRIVDDDISSAVAGVPKTLDPIEAEAKIAKAWKETRAYVQGSSVDEIYLRVASKYREMTKNPLLPGGIELYRSKPEHEPMIQQLWAEEAESVRILKERADIDKAVAKQLEAKLAKDAEKADLPLKPTELPLWFKRDTYQNPDPAMTEKEVRGGGYVRLDARGSQAVGYAQTIKQQLTELSEIIENNPTALKMYSVLGRNAEVFSPDAGRINAIMISLPALVRNFGEVGNLATTERKEAQTALIGLGSQETARGKVKTILNLINGKFRQMKLDPIKIDGPQARPTRARRGAASPLAPQPLAPPPGGVEEN